MSFPQRHLLGIETLEPQEIQAILDTADGMKEILDRPIKKVPALRGRTVINLFYEASTRTRSSFEVAERVRVELGETDEGDRVVLIGGGPHD